MEHGTRTGVDNLCTTMNGLTDRFLPARRYASAGISRHRVSVCLSVTRRYCIKTVKRRITQTTPRDSPGTLVF